MKSFKAKANMHIKRVAIPKPRVGLDEVLVKVHACGICGWDVLVAQAVAKNWSHIGHELAGEIVEIGKAVPPGLTNGQRVVVENSTFCGTCEQCKRGNVLHCSNMNHHREGSGFSEYIKVRYTSVYPCDGLDYRTAALAEPLTVAIDMVESAEIPLAGSVVVFGPGPIGLMIAKMAMVKGASRVYVTGHAHSTKRWEVAEALGVTDCIFVDEVDLVDYFQQHEPQGVDRVLVTSPPSTIGDAAAILRFGGIICYNGIKFGGGEKIVLDGNDFHFKRLQLRSVHSVPNLGWPQAIELLRTGVIDPDLFISHVYPFEKLPEAMHFAATARSETVKVMVDVVTPEG